LFCPFCRGSPKTTEETTPSTTSTTTSTTTTTEEATTIEATDSSAEYEYYYEYYDEDEEVADDEEDVVTTEQTSTSTSAELTQATTVPAAVQDVTLQTLLDLMRSPSAATIQQHPRTRPTFPPAIRTTTLVYGEAELNGNYLESHRSSVTVDSLASRVQSAGRLVSTTLR
jgi:hypothetical protein